MKNIIEKKYHFESTHEPYSIRKINVEINNECYNFFIDNTHTTIDISKQTLLRKNNEMEMLFDFNTKEGSIKLLEVDRTLPFEIIESDLAYENNILHLDFKYIIDQEMFVSISII